MPFGALCAVLLAGLILPAQGLAVVLLSNTGNTAEVSGEGIAATTRISQEFTTGGNPTGYWLYGIETFVSSAQATHTVLVCPVDSGIPQHESAACIGLTPPDDFAENTLAATEGNVFTAPEGTVLSASTTYSLYLIGTGVTGDLHVVTTTAVDAGNASNWSVQGYETLVGGSWTASVGGHPLKLRIVGNHLPTGSPLIRGIIQEGMTLTASTRRIRDADGLSAPDYAYQWMRLDGVNAPDDILGAIFSTYTLTEDDVGKIIALRVGFEDNDDQVEVVTSSPPTNPATSLILKGPVECIDGHVWCGEITVGRTTTASLNSKGYCAGVSAGGTAGISSCSYGSITAAAFTLDGTGYVVRSVRWGTGSGNTMHLTLDQDLQEADLSDWDFHVQRNRFALSEALRGNMNDEDAKVVAFNYRWPNLSRTEAGAVRDWPVGLRATVQLTPANEVPVFAVAALTVRVAENPAAAVDLGAPVTATDADMDVLSYALTGIDAGTFAIDAMSGQISTLAAATYDHEARVAYTVVVTADDDRGGTAAATVVIQVTDVDEPPPALGESDPAVAPTVGSLTSLDASWTTPTIPAGTPALTGYDVRWCAGQGEACDDADSEFTDIDFTGTGTSTTITGLAAGTLHQVWVRARNDEGVGPWARGSAATRTPPAFADDAPVFSVRENSAAGIPVGVVVATAADGGFLSYMMTGPDSASFTINTSGGRIWTTGSADYDFESTKSSYTVTVTVTDNDGFTATATVTIVVSDVDEPPPAPDADDLSVVPTLGSISSLDVRWTAPTVPVGTPAITGYDVQYCKGTATACAESSFTANTLTVTGLSATITGVDAMSEYQVRVRAKNAEGNSPWTGDSGSTSRAPVFDSDALEREVPENSAAGTPVGDRVTATDADGDLLTYALTSGDTGAFAIDASSGQIGTTAGVTYDHEARSKYTVTVTVDDGTGGTDTATVTITVTDVDEPPSAPGDLRVAAASDSTTALTVGWSAPTNTGKPAITGYDVRWCAGAAGAACDDADTEFTDIGFTGTGTSATITGLAEGTLYQAWVRAVNPEGGGAWAKSEGRASNSPEFDPATYARRLAENSVNAPVGDPIPPATDADNHSHALIYGIGGADAGSFSFDASTLQISTRTGEVYDFEARTSYTVTITVDDSRGGTGAATVVISLIDEIEAPSAPAAPTVTATAGATGSLDVSWAAPENTGPAITAYHVQYCKGAPADCSDPDNDFTDSGYAGTARSTTITGLDAATTYQVQVRASNEEATGAWSASRARATAAPMLTADYALTELAYAVEGGAGLAVEVVLSAAPGRPATVPLRATRGAGLAEGDYAGVPSALVFGATATRRTFTLTINDDERKNESPASLVLGFGTPLPTGVAAGRTATVLVVDDDVEIHTEFVGASPLQVDEDVGAVEVTVRTRTNVFSNIYRAELEALGLELELELETVDGTAVAQSASPDYMPLARTLTVAAADFGEDDTGCSVGRDQRCAFAERTLTLTVNDDRVHEPGAAERFSLRLTSDSDEVRLDGSSSIGALDYTVAIADDDDAPVPSLSVETAAVDENAPAVDSADPGNDRTVEMAVVFPPNGSRYATDQEFVLEFSGTAEPGTDFSFPAASTTVRIPKYSAAAVPLPSLTVADDRIHDAATETVVLRLKDGGDDVGSGVTVTITDDDRTTPMPRLAADAATVNEGAAPVVELRVEMPGSQYAAAKALTLDFLGTATEPKDFSASAKSLTIAAASSADVAAGTVTVVNDRFHEGMETIIARLLDGGTELQGSRVTLRVADDDDPPEPRIGFSLAALAESAAAESVASVRLPAGGSVYEAAKTLTLEFAQDTAPGTATEGVDFRVVGAKSVTLPAESEGPVEALRVRAIDDNLDEDPETEEIVAQLFDGGTLQSSATVTITDDDDPAVTVRYSATAYTAAEGGAAALVAVEISDDPERELVIPLAQSIADGALAGHASAADYSGVPASVTFPAGGQAAQRFMVAATDDDVDDDGEVVTLGFGTMPDAAVSAAAPASATVTLADDDARGVTLGATALAFDETDAATTDAYSVALDSQPTAAVTITLSATSATALPTLPAVGPTSLTFTASNWNVEQTVTVTAPADNDSVDEAATITHAASGGDYAALDDLTLPVTVDDDEIPPTRVTLSAAPATVAEGDGARSVTLSVALDGAALKEDLAVALAGAAGAMTEAADYAAAGLAGLTVTIAAQETGATASFMLTAVDDDLYEPETETFEVSGTIASSLQRLNRTGEPVNVELDRGDAARAAAIGLDSDDAPPMLAFTADRAELSEQDDPRTTGLDERAARLTLAIVNGVGFEHEQTVALAFAAPAGAHAAARGADYADDAPADDRLTLGAGVVSAAATVTVTAADDGLDEDDGTPGLDDEDERVEVTAMHAGEAVGTLALAILDDDHPPVTVRYSAAAYTAAEGGAPALVAVEIDVPGGNAGPERQLVIPLTQSISDGALAGQASAADYSGVPASVTFAAVGRDARQFMVAATDDDVDDDGETLALGFGAMPDAAARAGTPASATVTLADDDVRGLAFAPSLLRVWDSGEDIPGNGEYAVALASEPTAPVTATWTDNDRVREVRRGAGTVESLTFTPSNWNLAQVLKLIPEPDGNGVHEVVGWVHRASGGDYAALTQTYTLRVLDQTRQANTALLSVSPERVGEGAGATAVTVTALGADGPGSTTVTVTVTGDSADAADFSVSPSPLVIVIPGNEASAQGTFTLTPTDDTASEPAETLLVSGTASASGTVTVTVESASMTIVDNDTPGVSLLSDDQMEITRLAIREGDRHTYAVALDSAPSGTVTVTLSSSPAVEALTLAPTSLEFDGTNWNVEQSVTVQALQDDNATHERVVVTHTPTGGGYDGVEAPQLVVPVEDDEEGSSNVLLTLSETTLAESAGPTRVVVTGVLDGGSLTGDAVVALAVVGGTAEASDYTLDPAPPQLTLTVPRGALTGLATVTLTPTDDGVDEFDETLLLGGTVGGALGEGLAVVGASLRITDDDTRGVTVAPTALAVNEREETSYTVALDSAPTAAVTVALSVAQAATARLRATPAELVFTPQAYAVQTVRVSARGDADTDDGTVTVSHAVTGADYGASGVTAAAVVVSVTDTGSVTSDLGVSLNDASSLPEGDGGRTLVATVELLAGTLLETVVVPVSVTGVTADAADFQTQPAQFGVTLPAGALTATATFTLTPTDDRVDEEDETIRVQATAPAGLEAGDGVELTIVDDDTRAVVVTPTTLAVDERERTTYAVSLGSQPTAAVTVDLSVDAEPTARVQTSPTRLVFTPQDYAMEKTVVVSARGDADTDDGSATVSHAVTGADYGASGVTAAAVAVSVTDTGSVTSDLGVTLDDERPLPEGGGARRLAATVELLRGVQDEPVTATVSVTGVTADAADFQTRPAPLTVTIPANQTMSTVTFTLTPVDDGVVEGAETLRVGVAAPGLQADEGVELTIVDDDVREVVVTPTALAMEERQRMTYTVRLGSQPSGEVTVTPAAANSAAVALRLSPARLVFTPQDYGEKTVAVFARGDADRIGGQVLISHEVLGADYVQHAVRAAPVTVTVADDSDIVADLGLRVVGDASLPEGGPARQLVATVELLSERRPLTAVEVSVAGVTAEAGRDFQVQPPRFSVNFPADQTVRTVTFALTPVDDGVDERDETLQVVVAVPPEAVEAGDEPLLVGEPVELTIVDDDTRGVTVTPTALAMNERERATYALRLDSQPTAQVTVTAAPADRAGVDLRVLPETLVFTPQDYAAKTVVVFVRGDADLTGGEVEISHAVRGADYANEPAASVVVSVTDDSDIVADLGLRLDDASPLPEGGGARRMVATVELLSGARDSDVSTLVSVTGGTASAEDFQVQPPEFTVNIPAGSRGGTGTFTLTPVDDGFDEGDRTVRVELTVLQGTDLAGMLLEVDEPVELIIVDDDTRGVTVEPTALALDEGMQGRYTVRLGSQPSAPVTVTVTASGSDSVTAAPASLVFTGENWRAAQQVTVTAAQDPGPHDETLTVTHAVSGGDYAGESASSVMVSVADDDRPSEEVRLELAPDLIAENAGTVTITVTGTLDAAARNDETTVALEILPGDGYAATGATLTIAAGSASGAAQLTLAPTDDAVDRPDLEVAINARTDATATLVDGTVQPMRLAPASLTVTIMDDDERGVTVTPTEMEAREGRGAAYAVALSSAPDGGPVTVTPSMTDESPARPSGARLTSASLTFTATNWREAQTVTVTVADDMEVEVDAVALVTNTVSGADYEANDVTAATVALTVPGFEVENGAIRLRVPPDGRVVAPGDTSMPELAGIEVQIPPHLMDAVVAIRRTSVETRPRGYREGDVLTDITLEGNRGLRRGETATVCMPTDGGGRRVYRYDATAVPPEWVDLPPPTDGPPPGLTCGVTEHLGVSALGAAPGDETQGWLARFGRTVASQIVDTVGARLNAPAVQEAQLSLGGSAPQSALLSGVFNVLSGETAVDAKQALANSSFVLPLSAGDGAHWTAWGRGAYTEFEGEEDGVDLDGEVVTGTVGMDLARGDWLAGVALSRSEGDGDSLSEDGERGEMEISLTSVNPYVKVEMGGGLAAWSLAGFGEGDLERRRAGEETEVDLEMKMAAAGIEGPMGAIQSEYGAFGLTLKADALAVRMEADGEEDLPEVEADAQRLRLLLSGTGHYPSASGGAVRPMLEAGLRWDEGDAETGLGIELGAGFRFADAGGRFSTELTARGLVAHEESDYDEWGVGGSVVLGPEHNGRGLSLRLESGYGPVASGTQELWSRRDLAGLASDEPAALAGRLGLELGYGLNGPGGRGAWTPYLAYREEGDAELRVGARLDFGEAMRLELSALRRREENQGIRFQIQGRW